MNTIKLYKCYYQGFPLSDDKQWLHNFLNMRCGQVRFGRLFSIANQNLQMLYREVKLSLIVRCYSLGLITIALSFFIFLFMDQSFSLIELDTIKWKNSPNESSALNAAIL